MKFVELHFFRPVYPPLCWRLGVWREAPASHKLHYSSSLGVNLRTLMSPFGIILRTERRSETLVSKIEYPYRLSPCSGDRIWERGHSTRDPDPLLSSTLYFLGCEPDFVQLTEGWKMTEIETKTSTTVCAPLFEAKLFGKWTLYFNRLLFVLLKNFSTKKTPLYSEKDNYMTGRRFKWSLRR